MVLKKPTPKIFKNSLKIKQVQVSLGLSDAAMIFPGSVIAFEKIRKKVMF